MADGIVEASAALAAASLLITGVNFLGTHGPSVDDVLGARPGDETALHLRAAELTAAGTILAAGLVAAALTRQVWPLMVAGTTVVTGVAIYESVLRLQV